MGNWEALGKHARAMNDCFWQNAFLVLLTFIETDWRDLSPRQHGNLT